MPTRINKVLQPALVSLIVAVVCPVAATPGQAVSSEDVSNAIQKGVAYLKPKTDPNQAGGNFNAQGTLTLEVLALVNAGVPLDDPVVKNGLAAVVSLPNEHTYVVGLKIQVLAAADPKAYAKDIQAAANWLTANQSDSGMWSYTARTNRGGGGDNSNTQFALLGLHEAAKAGADVPKEVWERSRDHFTKSQCADGGWTYTGTARTGSYGSMTAAGLSGLYICGQRLMVGGPKAFVNGAYPDCGKYRQNIVLAKGLEWMAKNFSVQDNPNHRGQWVFYYLYGMERVGMVSGLKDLGAHDWYREGAAHLLTAQKPDGSWTGQVLDTSFAVLFLSKGNRPVLFQKIIWNDRIGKPGQWNRNIHDLENLTAFIGDKLGKPVTWQSTTLAPSVQELRLSPILYITGHDFPAFTDAEKQKLRQYVDVGGTLVFDACCGQESFRAGFRQFAADVFKDYPLRKLDPDHPVFNTLYPLKGPDTYGLEGIEVGCRTSVFFSPNALSCLWELETIPTFSDRAFKLGANIAAYATGKEQLPNKLDVIELPEAVKAAAQVTEVPRGAVRITRLWHEGDYNADPHMLLNLAAQLRDKAKVDVVAKEQHIKADDPKIFDYPVLFMTGHYTFKLSDTEIEGLRKYLDRGGCMVADACCGKPAFDASFRQMIKQLYPDAEFAPLAADHPIYTGAVGVHMGELKYRQILAGELNQRGTNKPPLEAVVIKGRTVIIYSKYDFSCALEGDNPFACRGYVDADGQKLALNIFLYAISY